MILKESIANAIIDNAGALMLVLDHRGYIVYFNRACEELSGYSFKEVQGKFPWDILLPQEDADMIRQQAFESLAHDAKLNAGHYTNYWVSKQGKRYLLEWSNTLIRDDAGRMRYMVSLGSDITERRHAHEALEESEQRFRVLFEHAPEAITLFDPELGRFVDVNENATTLFGRSWEELTRLNPAALSTPTQPDGRSSNEAATLYIQQTIEGETPVFEWTNLKPDGKEISCEVRLVRLPLEGRTLVRASITDITERKRMEAALKNANARLMELASQDHLTRLPNRRNFESALEKGMQRHRKEEQTISLLLIDIDNFKQINDDYGHPAGDAVLVQVASILRALTREGDMAARYAGDEFVLWMQCNESVARQRAKEIIDHVANTSFNWQRHAIKATISVGLSFLSPDNEKSAEALLHEADQAMYQAKRAGKNRYA